MSDTIQVTLCPTCTIGDAELDLPAFTPDNQTRNLEIVLRRLQQKSSLENVNLVRSNTFYGWDAVCGSWPKSEPTVRERRLATYIEQLKRARELVQAFVPDNQDQEELKAGYLATWAVQQGWAELLARTRDYDLLQRTMDEYVLAFVEREERELNLRRD